MYVHEGKKHSYRYAYNSKISFSGDPQPYGWIGELLLNKETPSVQFRLEKYSTSVLNYETD
jgi:hypothetical protein